MYMLKYCIFYVIVYIKKVFVPTDHQKIVKREKYIEKFHVHVNLIR